MSKCTSIYVFVIILVTWYITVTVLIILLMAESFREHIPDNSISLEMRSSVGLYRLSEVQLYITDHLYTALHFLYEICLFLYHYWVVDTISQSIPSVSVKLLVYKLGVFSCGKIPFWLLIQCKQSNTQLNNDKFAYQTSTVTAGVRRVVRYVGKYLTTEQTGSLLQVKHLTGTCRKQTQGPGSQHGSRSPENHKYNDRTCSLW